MTVGGPGADQASGLAADGQGGALVAARIEGADALIGGLSAKRSGEEDTVVARLSADGKPMWAKFLAIDAKLVGGGDDGATLFGKVGATTTLGGVAVAQHYLMRVNGDGAIAWVVALPASTEHVGGAGPKGRTAFAFRRADGKIDLRVVDAAGAALWTWLGPSVSPPSALVVHADGGVVGLGMVGGAKGFAPTLPAAPTWTR